MAGEDEGERPIILERLSLPEHPHFGPIEAHLLLPDDQEPWVGLWLEEWRECYELSLADLDEEGDEIPATSWTVGAQTVLTLGAENRRRLREKARHALLARRGPTGPRSRPSDLSG